MDERSRQRQQMAELLTRAHTLPAELLERLDEKGVILRLELPQLGMVNQCHFTFWEVPVRRPKLGLLARGSEFKVGSRATEAGSIGNFLVLIGSGPEDSDVRAKAAQLHHAMIQECGNSGTLLPVEPSPQDVAGQQAVFLVADGGRAVAFATTSLVTDETLLGCHVEGDEVRKDRCMMLGLPAGSGMRQVELLWVARDYRGNRLGESLLHFVAEHHGVTTAEMAYMRPFTRGGFLTVRRAAGDRFWTSGEMFSAAGPASLNGRLMRPHRVLDMSQILGACA